MSFSSALTGGQSRQIGGAGVPTDVAKTLPGINVLSLSRSSARLDALAETRIVAQTAAALGREFSQPALATVMGQDGQTLREALAELLDSGLIVRIGMHVALESWFKDGVAWTAPMLMLAATEMGRRGEVHTGLDIARKVLELAHPHRSGKSHYILCRSRAE